jgi:hypothetical protein
MLEEPKGDMEFDSQISIRTDEVAERLSFRLERPNNLI